MSPNSPSVSRIVFVTGYTGHVGEMNSIERRLRRPGLRTTMAPDFWQLLRGDRRMNRNALLVIHVHDFCAQAGDDRTDAMVQILEVFGRVLLVDQDCQFFYECDAYEGMMKALGETFAEGFAEDPRVTFIHTGLDVDAVSERITEICIGTATATEDEPPAPVEEPAPELTTTNSVSAAAPEDPDGTPDQGYYDSLTYSAPPGEPHLEVPEELE